MLGAGSGARRCGLVLVLGLGRLGFWHLWPYGRLSVWAFRLGWKLVLRVEIGVRLWIPLKYPVVEGSRC